MEEILRLDQIKEFQGKLAESSENIYKCYNLYEKALEIHRKVYAYGMLRFHLDMANSENIKLFKRCEALSSEFRKATSFITPEITKSGCSSVGFSGSSSSSFSFSLLNSGSS